MFREFFVSVEDGIKGPIKQLRPQIVNPDTLGARITGLSSNHNYRFYVYARTKTGRGEASFLDVKTKAGQRKISVSNVCHVRMLS